MKLTSFSDYALRLLMHLAVNEGGLVTIAQTADRYKISKNHMMKVAHHLVKDGYVTSVRGRSGGLYLARKPESINIGHIVRDMEQDTALVECFPGGKATCMITTACRLSSVLAQAQTAFYDCLNQFTLADLLTDNTALEKLLLEKAEQ
ncbi:RrF2 family transcriptional regulator [Robiginitomaculum antarcticum]|uniref:RrF2 family transcriptional regulator n=1 Tax=Robiginitomaculum antarcticum TaxID=437507 RepID=UPI000362F26B|nr:Rrf2 family transcriptional regulator [Robiginitomaculum antarcticum]